MSLDKYILRDGKIFPAEDFAGWDQWFRKIENRRLHKTEIGSVTVSTVFLGVDHSDDERCPPILFETLVTGGSLDSEITRYATLGDAKIGHHAMVERVRDADKAGR